MKSETGTSVPTFIYGTAWKEDRTRGLVEMALHKGFRAIDTANQRRHYHEAAVGEALGNALSQLGLTREDIFLQTKFTYAAGQDHRLPYDPRATIADQVRQSFESSLSHLGTTYIDSYVLHGPSVRYGLGTADWEAWRAMEEVLAQGKARALGVSNVGADQLEELCRKAKVAPTFVQNRCYAELSWDLEVRQLCRRLDIRYEGFSLLTANPQVVRSGEVRRMATRVGKTPAQVVFRFTRQAGMIPLTGTTDPKHMEEDLAIDDFALTEDEVRSLEILAS